MSLTQDCTVFAKSTKWPVCDTSVKIFGPMVLRLNFSIIIWLFSKAFPHCALSWLTSGPTRDEFLYKWNWSKSFLSLLKSRPSCRPSSSKSSWCFKKRWLNLRIFFHFYHILKKLCQITILNLFNLAKFKFEIWGSGSSKWKACKKKCILYQLRVLLLIKPFHVVMMIFSDVILGRKFVMIIGKQTSYFPKIGFFLVFQLKK